MIDDVCLSSQVIHINAVYYLAYFLSSISKQNIVDAKRIVGVYIEKCQSKEW